MVCAVEIQKSFKPEAMRPVYEPAYAFTSDTESAYDGRLGENETRTVGSGENRRTETYIRWFYVKGTYVKRFEDMVIEASVHLDQRQMDKIGPFDTANALEYRKEFLAGYVAERPCDSVQKCFETAKSKMDAEIKRGILNKYSADHVDYLNIYTNHKTIFFKAILYPIYHSFLLTAAKIRVFRQRQVRQSKRQNACFTVESRHSRAGRFGGSGRNTVSYGHF